MYVGVCLRRYVYVQVGEWVYMASAPTCVAVCINVFFLLLYMNCVRLYAVNIEDVICMIFLCYFILFHDLNVEMCRHTQFSIFGQNKD